MDFEVFRQVITAGKLLLADNALVRLYTRMGTAMAGELIRPGEPARIENQDVIQMMLFYLFTCLLRCLLTLTPLQLTPLKFSPIFLRLHYSFYLLRVSPYLAQKHMFRLFLTCSLLQSVTTVWLTSTVGAVGTLNA